MEIKTSLIPSCSSPEDLKRVLQTLCLSWGDVVEDLELLEIIPIKGGMTNKVYQINWPSLNGQGVDRRVLVRIYGVGVDLFFNREDEIKTFECMSRHGYGPKLLGRFQDGRLEEFIHARTLSAYDLRIPETSDLIAAKLREFHKFDMPGPKKIVLWERLKYVHKDTFHYMYIYLNQEVRLPRDSTFGVLWQEFKNIKSLPPSGVSLGSLSPWIIWNIWLARNQKVFKQTNFSTDETVTKAIKEAREWQLAQVPKGPGNQRRHSQNKSNNAGEAVIQTDAAWSTSKQAAGAAWLLSSQRQEIIFQESKTYPNVTSPLVAEGLAIRDALSSAHNKGFMSLAIESDSLQIIKAINEGLPLSILHGVLADIAKIVTMFEIVIFKFIPREANMLADSLAKRVLSLYGTSFV